MARNFLDRFVAFHQSVFPAGGGFQCQAAIGPQLPLGAKTMRRLHQSNQQSRPNGSNRRNLSQQFRRAMLPAFRQQISSYLLAQRLQCV